MGPIKSDFGSEEGPMNPAGLRERIGLFLFHLSLFVVYVFVFCVVFCFVFALQSIPPPRAHIHVVGMLRFMFLI